MAGRVRDLCRRYGTLFIADEVATCWTYGWHPHSVSPAIATLRDLKTNRRRLLAGVAEMTAYFRTACSNSSSTARQARYVVILDRAT